MSSDLFYYEDSEDPDHALSLDMKVSGLLGISIYDDKFEVSSFYFSPNEKSKKVAKDLADALLFWIEHLNSIEIK